MKIIRYILLAGLIWVGLFTPVLSAGSPLPGDFHKAYIEGHITCSGQVLTGVKVVAYSEDNGQALTVNAANGNYALGVSAGEWTVAAYKEGYFLPKASKIKVAGEDTATQNLELQKSTAFIEGTVVNEARKPVSGAWVMAMPNQLDTMMQEGGSEPPRMDPSQANRTVCDAKGNFRLQTVKGKYLLIGAAPGYEMSAQNPQPKIPGMENIPEEYRGMMANIVIPGIEVTVDEGETRTGVVIILRPAQSHASKSSEYLPQDRPPASVPVVNLLVGEAKITTNNVLHWTRSKPNPESAFYVVVRSTVDFGSKESGETVKFQFPQYMTGEPQPDYFSFTDYTAISGKTYWYAVYEMVSSVPGPYSNSVKLVTK